MTILVEIQETFRAMGRNQDWARGGYETLRFDTVADAMEAIRDRYPQKRRKPIYQDTKSRGTIQAGWIFSNKLDWEKTFQQDWVTLAEVTSETEKTCASIDVRTVIARIKSEAA